MTSSLTGFDDWLNRRLEECAREAGEDVVTYVGRAVAARMVTEFRRVNSPSITELMAHLSNCAAYGDLALPASPVVIADPDRLRALHATGLLDSAPDESYDRITSAAAVALDAPCAAVSLVDVDRQFFKSVAGMNIDRPEQRETSLERSICQYTVANGEPLMIEDARIHPIFQHHAAVLDGTVVAYLGVPLSDGNRNAVGTLCVFDTKPRTWSAGHVQVLGDLAGLVSDLIFGRAAT